MRGCNGVRLRVKREGAAVWAIRQTVCFGVCLQMTADGGVHGRCVRIMQRFLFVKLFVRIHSATEAQSLSY